MVVLRQLPCAHSVFAGARPLSDPVDPPGDPVEREHTRPAHRRTGENRRKELLWP
ncbi:hypothetical protein [Streptomyces sp. NPDC048196]|uniref:hypothetical protein n=1 Tax=Streptomyces sp. NPDC048196 TaxID=3154712 RepID=UPI0033D9E473